MPTAVLRVFYGLNNSKDGQLRRMMGLDDRHYQTWKAHMKLLLMQDGIEYIGEVTPDTLQSELASGGFLLYPTRFPEVGCITVMKAMAAGCIPITSRYKNSVLGQSLTSVDQRYGGVGITGKFDLGPDTPYSDEMNYTLWLERDWVPSVIAAYWRANSKYGVAVDDVTCLSDELHDHRANMIAYSQNIFSWRKSAEAMERMLFHTGMTV